MDEMEPFVSTKCKTGLLIPGIELPSRDKVVEINSFISALDHPEAILGLRREGIFGTFFVVVIATPKHEPAVDVRLWFCARDSLVNGCAGGKGEIVVGKEAALVFAWFGE
jgi:hypothetical protein